MIAYGGVTTDHLYRTCPALRRTIPRWANPDSWVGRQLVGEVDPEGTDICGWCRRKWLARDAEKP